MDIKKVLLALGMSVVSGLAQATIYDVAAVLDGSNTPGFGASGFHDSSGSNVMSGPSLAGINSVIGGSYDDADGHLMVALGMSNGGAFLLDGFLQFGTVLDPDVLSIDSTVSVDFDTVAEAAGFVDTTIGFWGEARVCCSGDYAPNSLAAGIDSQIMTLWGSNFVGASFTEGYEGATLGMDLVLDLNPSGPAVVPVPASVWLFASGLLGMVGIARRRN